MMFKNLKEKVAIQFNKTNQTHFSALLSNDSTSLPKDSDVHASSIAKRDDNENHRFRLSSASSNISRAPITHTNYVPPSRQFIPPSGIESEHGSDDESEFETNSKMRKLFDICNNKFTQLKNAYAEDKYEKDNIRNVLQKYQNTSIQQQTKLREQLKLERQVFVEQLENLYREELKFRDHQIEELIQQFTKQTEADKEEMQYLGEKITELETLLTQCKEGIQTYQNKQADLINERDDLLQQLNEKQAMMIDHQSEDATLEVKEHSDSDMNVLLHDKQHLQEQLESIRLYVGKLVESAVFDSVTMCKVTNIENDAGTKSQKQQQALLSREANVSDSEAAGSDNNGAVEETLPWVENNIPTSIADSTLQALDSDEEVVNTKLERSKMQ